jgi:hemoglobin
MELNDETELFAAVGGDERLFYELVEAFYVRTEADAPLRALYPADLEPGKRHLAWFLIQRFGGPAHFNNRRGAPMLRRRHAEFEITREQAGRWFQNMSAAIDDVAAFAPYKALMLRFFDNAATFLINRDERDTTVFRQLTVEQEPDVELPEPAPNS